MAAGHSMVNVEDRRRRKTMEILAATANRALAEVNYTPHMTHMAQKIAQLQDENSKLWQDNVRLQQDVVTLQQQARASAAPSSREELLQQQVEQLMHKVNATTNERDAMQRARDQLLATPTPENRYQHLYTEYQKLDASYKTLLMESNSLKMMLRQQAPGMVPGNHSMVNTTPTQLSQGRLPQGQGIVMQHSQRHPSMGNMAGMTTLQQAAPGQVANPHNLGRGKAHAFLNQYPQAQHGYSMRTQAVQQQTQGHIMLNQAPLPNVSMTPRQSPVHASGSQMQHHYNTQIPAQVPMPHAPARVTGVLHGPPAASPPAARPATAGPSDAPVIDLTGDEPSSKTTQNIVKRPSTAPGMDREPKRPRSADQHIAKESADSGVVAEMVGPMQEMLGDGIVGSASNDGANNGQQMSVDDLYGDLSGNGAAEGLAGSSAIFGASGESTDNGRRTDEECVALMWEEDAETPGGIFCVVCYHRFEKGLQPEPDVLVNYKPEELVVHCKDNHPTMWDDLQWKRDLVPPTNPTS